MGTFDFAVQAGCGRPDVGVLDASVDDVPVEKAGLELGAVVGLDGLDLERELLEDVVQELDRGLLVVLVGRRAARAGGCSRRWPCTGSTFRCLVVPGSGSRNFTSIWTWWPGWAFS